MRKFIWILSILLACTAQVESTDIRREALTNVSRPTTYPTWATNTNYASGPAAGTPTKVTPSAGQIADGWRPQEAPPATQENWWHGFVGDWVTWLDSGSLSRAAIKALTDVTLGTRVFSRDRMCWYEYETIAIYANDDEWTLDATGMSAGQWVAIPLKLPIAKVGPAPNDAFLSATPAGRINKQVVPMGVFAYTVNAFSSSYNTSSGSNVTLGTPIDTNGFSATMRPLLQSDVIEMQVSAWIAGNSAANFNVQVWLETSADAGTTWTPVTAGAGALSIALTADNLPKALPLTFFTTYPAYGSGVAGRFMVRLRAISDGTHQLVVTVDSDIFRVSRP